jgi:hypothetical protein
VKKPTNIKQLQRESRTLVCTLTGPSTIAVSSSRDPRTVYRVHFDFVDDEKVYATCDCPWGHFQGVGCSHVMAAMEYLANLKNRTLSFWSTQDEAERQNKKTFFLTKPDDESEGLWITSRGA